MKVIIFIKDIKKLKEIQGKLQNEDLIFLNSQSELFEEILGKKALLCVEIGFFNAYKDYLETEHKVLILSDNPSYVEGKKLLEQKIHGYANLNMNKKYFLHAIKTIKNGDIWLYPEFIQTMIKSVSKGISFANKSKLDELSNSEQEVANLIYSGLSNEEIAQELKVKERTIKAHIGSIYKKLNVKDKVSLVLYLNNA